MAILFPDLAQISELKVPPTEGELHLLNHLNEHLDDSFEKTRWHFNYRGKRLEL